MKERRHYSRAPITEAMIDLRVNPSQEATLAALKVAYTSIASEYPNKEALLVVQGEMRAGASVGATASQTQVGFAFASSDRRQIVQARLDGFSFSRLAPYEHWEVFRDEAIRLWEVYQAAMNPIAIHRLAVRYINRLDIPLPMRDFTKYLRAFPEIPSNLSESISGYFMQLQIPKPEIEANLILNQGVIPPPNDSVVSVLLDIDLFKLCDASTNVSIDTASFWDDLEVLHESIDQAFEACITDSMRELIK